MTENCHHVQLTIDGGELHRNFVCTAPEDAPCRRRPKDWEMRESWTREEATETGFPCWAVEWIEAVGIEDAIMAYPDQVLASVPVTISYSEGVEITPVPNRPNRSDEDEFAPGECDGSSTCTAPIHVHGCYAPHRSDQCDSPEEYGHTDRTVGASDE